MGEYGLKPLDDESVALLSEFYQKLIEKRKHCYFCQGGNTCRCGQCPEFEYHDTECLVNLIGSMISDYRRRKETAPPHLVLITIEELQWYRHRIKELEDKMDFSLEEITALNMAVEQRIAWLDELPSYARKEDKPYLRAILLRLEKAKETT